MKSHLNHLIPWNSIFEISCFKYNKTSMKMKTGRCKKIHIENKDDKFKIKNRNYITDFMICKDNNCKTIPDYFIDIKNPKIKDHFKMVNFPSCFRLVVYKVNKFEFIAESDYGHKDECFRKDYGIILNFFKQFNNTLSKFSEDLLQKLLLSKRKKYKKLFVIPEDYNDNDVVKEFLGNNYDIEDFIMCKRLIACCFSDNHNDLLSILNTVILDKDYLYNCYKQKDGYGHSKLGNFIHYAMLPLYFNLNMFIAKGKFDEEKIFNEKLFTTPGCGASLHYFTSLLHEAFPPFLTKKLFKKLNEENHQVMTENLNIEEIPYTLKKIFKFLYTLLAMYKFQNLHHNQHFIPDIFTDVRSYVSTPNEILTEEYEKEIDKDIYYHHKWYNY